MGLRGTRQQGNGENYIMKSLVICTYAGGKIEKNEMGGACGAYGGGVHRVLVGKPEGKRPLGRPRRRWEDNIKMDLQEVRWVVRTGWNWFSIVTGGGHL